MRGAYGGVRRSLDVEHFCIGTQSIADEIWDGGVHKAEFQAKVDEELRGKAENTSVNRFGQDDMVAWAQQPEDRVDSRHPRRKNIRAVATFQFTNRAFQGFTVRVVRSRVVVAFILAH